MPTWLPIQWAPADFSALSGRNMKVAAYLGPALRIRGSLPPMCSVVLAWSLINYSNVKCDLMGAFFKL